MHKWDKKKLAVKSKVWLELNEKPFIGAGRIAVLQAIDRHGSILKAAEETRISYRRIRGALRQMEQAMGLPLVQARRGGKEGGGAEITDSARELIRLFEKQQEGIMEEVNELFKKLFLNDPLEAPETGGKK